MIDPAITRDVVNREVAATTATANRIVQETIDAQPLQERVAFRLRFGNGMSVADIARSLRYDQKKLYRRLDAIVRRLRVALTRAGISAAEAETLIGVSDSHLEFGLHDAENDRPRQAMDVRGSGSEVPER